MIYSELIDEVIARAFPEGTADNLRAIYEKRILSGLIEAQRYVPYLKLHQTRLYPFSSTLYRQGNTVLCKPPGKVKRLSTFSSKTLKDWVNYDRCTKEDIERWTQQRARLAAYPDAIPAEFGSFNSDPTLDKGWRAERGLFAIDRDQIIILPHIDSVERVMVEWSGSKAAFADGDLVNFGPLDDNGVPKYQEQVITALENYLRWKSVKKDDRSGADSLEMQGEWMASIAGLQLDTKDDTEAEFPLEDIGILPRTAMPRNPFVTPLGSCEYDPADAFFESLWVLCPDNGKFYELGALIMADQVVERISGSGESGGAPEVTYETVRVDRLSMQADDQQFYNLAPHLVDGEPTHGFDGEEVCPNGKTICRDVAVKYVDIKSPDDGKHYRLSLSLQGGVVTINIDATPLDCAVPCPTEITASSAGDATITLEWKEIEGASSYRVEKSLLADGPFSAVATTLETTYTDTSVANDEAVYYRIITLNSCGDGTPSSSISLTPAGPIVFPLANFTATPNAGYVPLEVQLVNTSTNATSYDWDFGDGSPHRTDQNPPNHVYQAAGNYTITLTATSNQGVDAHVENITVASQPVVEPPDQTPPLTPLAWFMADRGVFTDNGITPASNGDRIRQWNDQSGRNCHALQATFAQRPTLVANQINGKPAVRFSRAAITRMVASMNGPINQPVGIFTVAKFSDAGAISTVYTDHDTTYSYLLERTASNGIYMNSNASKPAQAIGTSPAPAVGTYFYSEAIYGVGGNSSLAINGATPIPGNVDLVVMFEMTLGGRKWDTNGLEGDIVEILMFGLVNGYALTPANRVSIINYLKAKYAL